MGTVTAADTDPFKAAAYAFLKDVSGLHIGLTNDNYDSTASAMATFSNFSTTLPVVLPKTTDNFFGPKLNPTWTFVFPGSWSDGGYTPGNSSEDPGNNSVGNGVFAVNAQNSGLYGLTSYIRNVASATVAPTATGDYDIEIAADGAFNNPNANNSYPFYGLLVYTDAGNYFSLGAKHSGYVNNGVNANYNYANTTLTINNSSVGNYDNLATYNNLGYGPTLYRIRKSGNHHLRFLSPNRVIPKMSWVRSAPPTQTRIKRASTRS